jgi:hypothetical protein
MSEGPHEAKYEPAWAAAALLGSQRVLPALVELSQEAPSGGKTKGRWAVSDYESFEAALRLDNELCRTEIIACLPEHAGRMCRKEIVGWRTALPFHEAERDLLGAAYEEAFGDRAKLAEISKEVRFTDFDLAIRGVHHVVSGRDLLDRWWQWRRGVEEFSERGAFDEAIRALAHLTRLLVPAPQLPLICLEIENTLASE